MILVNRITLVFSLKILKENSVVITTVNLQLRLETHDKDFATIMSNNFNGLPLHIRQITERKKFIDTLRMYLLDKVKVKYFL